jgi:serine/threonine protein kinase
MEKSCFCPLCGAAHIEGQAHCLACGAALEPGTSTGETKEDALLNGRYQVVEILGSGGFSAVYRALDMQVQGREVAIKQITLHGLSTEEIIEATDTFNREVTLLSALRHPQIPRIYNNFSDREHWYVVMEYIHGQTLEAYLEARATVGKHLDFDEALDIGLQLCNVLQYLHTRQPPVIFRDLKPGNIMRTASGKLYLVDFGIARHFKPGQTHDTQPLGSPGYAAPEQYGRAQTTPQADIYSLGALFYELLSGRNVSDTMSGFPPLHLDGVAGGEELAALVQRMLSSKPEERPAGVQEVAVVLERVSQESEPGKEKPPWRPSTPHVYTPATASQQQIQVPRLPLPQQPVRGSRVSRRALLGWGTAAVIAGGGFFLFSHLSQFTQPTRTSPTPRPSNPPTLPAFPYWSPSLSYVAHVVEVNNTVQILNGPTQQVISTLQGAYVAGNSLAPLLWSPDETRIMTTTSSASLGIWTIRDGQQVGDLKHSPPGEQLTGADWSRDGKRIVSGGSDGFDVWLTDGTHLATVPIDDATSRRNMQLNEITWSPDNRHLAFVAESSTPNANPTSWTVFFWDTDTNKSAGTVSGPKTIPGDASGLLAWSPDGELIAYVDYDNLWLLQYGNPSAAQTLTTTNTNQFVLDMAWSPDGSYLATADELSDLAVWRVADHSQVFSTSIDDTSDFLTPIAGPADLPMICGLGWSKDGKNVLAAYGSGEGTQVIDHWSVG